MKKLYSFLIILFLFTSCNKTPTQKEKALVIVTIAPYQYLVEQIAKEEVSIQTLTPAGSNPHVYEPSVKQVVFLSKAAIWFQVGEAFETKNTCSLVEKNPNLLVVDLKEGVDLIASEENVCLHCSPDAFDRHIWLSPERLVIQAETIKEALSQKLPEKKEFFEENCKVLIEEINAKNEVLRGKLEKLSGKALLVSHPAFGYFCHDFKLHQLSIEQEGKEARARHIEKILKELGDRDATLGIALPQYNNKGLELIAKKLELPIYTIDPYAPNMLETMMQLADFLTVDEIP